MAGFAPPNRTAQVDPKTKIDEKVDYSNLRCPYPYEEIHREATMSLEPELFEGFRLDYNKKMNHKFSLRHSISMGPTPIGYYESQIRKTPSANYEFGVNFTDQKLMLDGKLMTDGAVTGRVKCDLTENCTIKTYALLTNERGAEGEFTVDYKGSDYRTQLQLGNYWDPFDLGTDPVFKANYIQHVTPKLSLGGEVLWRDQPESSHLSCAARYETDQMIASGQVESSGAANMNYVHKVTDKISLAAGYSYHSGLRYGTASVGYDIMFRQSRVRGKINSYGVISTHVEEELGNGLGLLLSAEVDHVRKDYKFGYGVKYEYPPSQ